MSECVKRFALPGVRNEPKEFERHHSRTGPPSPERLAPKWSFGLIGARDYVTRSASGIACPSSSMRSRARASTSAEKLAWTRARKLIVPFPAAASRARSALTESKGIPKRARVRFNLLAGFGGQRGWRELILWTCGACGGGGRGGSVLPFGGQDVHGQRRQRCEVVAAPARRRQSGRAEDGRSQGLPCGARARLGSGADLREAGSHAARSPPGAGRPRPGGQLLCALAFSAARRRDVQKKPSRLRTGPAGYRQAA